MSRLADYLKENREKVYASAVANTTYDDAGRAVISKDDEWVSETEWDDVFLELSGKN